MDLLRGVQGDAPPISVGQGGACGVQISIPISNNKFGRAFLKLNQNTVLSHWEPIWLSWQFYFSNIFGHSHYWGSSVMVRSWSINSNILFYYRPRVSTSPCQVSLDHSLVSTHTISCKVNYITRQTKHWPVLENTLRQQCKLISWLANSSFW